MKPTRLFKGWRKLFDRESMRNHDFACVAGTEYRHVSPYYMARVPPALHGMSVAEYNRARGAAGDHGIAVYRPVGMDAPVIVIQSQRTESVYAVTPDKLTACLHP